MGSLPGLIGHVSRPRLQSASRRASKRGRQPRAGDPRPRGIPEFVTTRHVAAFLLQVFAKFSAASRLPCGPIRKSRARNSPGWCAATSPKTRESSSSKSGCACCSSSWKRCAISASPAIGFPSRVKRSAAAGPTIDSQASGVPAQQRVRFAVVPGFDLDAAGSTRKKNDSASGLDAQRQGAALELLGTGPGHGVFDWAICG
jgi:hypothetical protein